MGKFIDACPQAWDGLERARNERNRFAVTPHREKHLPSFARSTFIVRKRCGKCLRMMCVELRSCVDVVRRKP